MRMMVEFDDYDTPDNRIEAVNTAIEIAEDTLVNENSYSVLMFFEDAIPIRIRSNQPDTLNVDGSKLKTSLDRWSTDGQGPLIVRTSTRKHMNDIYPSKTIRESPRYDGETDHRIYFHYYDGKYGNGELWRAVKNARNYNNSVGDAVKDYFSRRSFGFACDDIVHNNRIDYDTVETNERDFNYTVYNSLGDTVVDVGRKGEKVWCNYSPTGAYFIGGQVDE